MAFTISPILFSQKKDVELFDKTLNQFQNVRDFCISSDGNEAFFTIQSPNDDISQIVCIKKNADKWSEPMLLPFCNAFMYMEPFLSSDQKRLYFVSDRPVNELQKEKKDFDIWYVERKDKNSDWSPPKNIGFPVNSEQNEFYPTLSDNNNLYFTIDSPKGRGKDDIYCSEWKNSEYTTPVLLNDSINSEGYEFNAFISKKEDFLLFTKYNADGGYGSGDLYIARKNGDGKWGKAVNLGLPINTRYMEYCPYYDSKTEMLYFTSRRNTLQPQEFKSVSELQHYISGNENGLSKIYRIPFKME